MSREIKFRAWNKNEKRMIYGFPDFYSSHFYEGKDSRYPDIGWDFQILEIMQYTGLKDKNGKEIYEGDILDFDAKEWGREGFISVVSWDKEEGCWNWGGGTSHDNSRFRQVIGNIYENPDLVKEAK